MASESTNCEHCLPTLWRQYVGATALDAYDVNTILVDLMNHVCWQGKERRLSADYPEPVHWILLGSTPFRPVSGQFSRDKQSRETPEVRIDVGLFLGRVTARIRSKAPFSPFPWARSTSPLLVALHPLSLTTHSLTTNISVLGTGVHVSRGFLTPPSPSLSVHDFDFLSFPRYIHCIFRLCWLTRQLLPKGFCYMLPCLSPRLATPWLYNAGMGHHGPSRVQRRMCECTRVVRPRFSFSTLTLRALRSLVAVL